MRVLYHFVCLSMVVILFSACSEEKSDSERILEDTDSASVHLALGMKIITSNPNSDPDITAAQETLRHIIDATKSTTPEAGLNLLQIGQLAKVAYQAKQLGAEEVGLGKQSNFKYLSHLFATDENSQEITLTVEQDHALTLAALYILKLQPAVPIPVSRETFLYEAWMAGNTEVSDKTINGFLRAAQVSTFANND